MTLAPKSQIIITRPRSQFNLYQLPHLLCNLGYFAKEGVLVTFPLCLWRHDINLRHYGQFGAISDQPHTGWGQCSPSLFTFHFQSQALLQGAESMSFLKDEEVREYVCFHEREIVFRQAGRNSASKVSTAFYWNLFPKEMQKKKGSTFLSSDFHPGRSRSAAAVTPYNFHGCLEGGHRLRR